MSRDLRSLESGSIDLTRVSLDIMSQGGSARTWVSDLFEALERRDLHYVALRSDEELLASGREIDLLVHPGHLARVLDETARLCESRPELKVVYWREYPRHAATVILTTRSDTGHLDDCRLDIRSAIHKHGLILVDASRIRREETLWDTDLGVRRLIDPLEVALLILRNTVDGRTPNDRHSGILSRQPSPSVLGRAVARLGFDESALRERGNVQASTPQITAKLNYGLRALYGRALKRASGLNVALYGPDGVGKSTQSHRIAGFFDELGLSSRTRMYHAFVPTSELTSRSASKTVEVKKKMFRRTHSPVVMLGLMSASYLKRLPKVIGMHRAARRKGTISIHDRYLLDVFLKLHKTRARRWPRAEIMLARLMPSSDLIFLLRADPATIADRSDELEREEVVNAYAFIERCLARSRSPVFVIDANATADSVSLAIEDRIREVQNQRFLAYRRVGTIARRRH